MKLLFSIILTVAVSTLLSVLILKNFSAPEKERLTTQESAYDRVMRTNNIRCGYIHWEPGFIVDSNTKALSGIFYDLTEEIGKRLSLKIEWVEETGWATAIEGVANGRYDAVCSNFWPTPARARLADFSIPVSKSPLYMWVRAGDPLLQSKPADINQFNDEKYEFTFVDGTTAAQIIQRRFPKAKTVSYPEKTPIPDMINGLALGKAQITIMDGITVGNFLKTNPDKLVKLYPDVPTALYPNVMLLPAGDMRFKSMIDHTIRDILSDGTFDGILKKYNAENTYVPLNK